MEKMAISKVECYNFIDTLSRPDIVPQVVVVGAGPTGLLISLNLARHSIPVEVLEAKDEVDESSCAALRSAPGVWEIRRVGILDDTRDAGCIPQKVYIQNFQTPRLLASTRMTCHRAILIDGLIFLSTRSVRFCGRTSNVTW
jgi:hypothetical protein